MKVYLVTRTDEDYDVFILGVFGNMTAAKNAIYAYMSNSREELAEEWYSDNHGCVYADEGTTYEITEYLVRG